MIEKGNVDTIIIGRGGGSIEDLCEYNSYHLLLDQSPFNEVNKSCQSFPLISPSLPRNVLVLIMKGPTS